MINRNNFIGIPINQQHLLLGDKELNNNTYLKEIGITKGCTLKLVLGMRGGPISTRRASSRSEHLIWREIKDFVETTRYVCFFFFFVNFT